MENIKNPQVKKVYYEKRLWEKAEELSELRVRLQKEPDDLYTQVQNKDVNAIGLHAEELLRALQAKYFETLEEIDEVKAEENELQSALEAVDAGKIDEKFLIDLVGKEEGPKLSRRKKRIFEERQRSGVDPRSGDLVKDPYGLAIDTYIVKQQGVGSNKLTTGRHAKGISGNLGSGSWDSKEIERKFFESTQDTHGGKVKYGKDGKSYVSNSGKRIRKS